MNHTLIIAEAGVNHNGSIDMAKGLIDVAADAGVDYVKFQTFKAENLVTKYAVKAEYQQRNMNTLEVDEAKTSLCGTKAGADMKDGLIKASSI